VLRTRQGLAQLWLPWCVDADNPDRTVRDHHPGPALHPRAAQLRLTDLTTPVIQRALAGQPYRPGEWSWQKIQSIAADYRAREDRGETVIVDDDDDPSSYQQPTFMTDGGVRMLSEGSHCTSAPVGRRDRELRAATRRGTAVLAGLRELGYTRTRAPVPERPA
jgi:hypothetical protein